MVSWGLHTLLWLQFLGTEVPFGLRTQEGDIALALAELAQFCNSAYGDPRHLVPLSFLAGVSGGINWQQGQVGVD